MNTKNQNIPHKISHYLKERFRDNFLFELKGKRKVEDQLQYFIEVAKDHYIYQLRFNEKGEFLNEDFDEAFPSDVHDEPAV